MTTPSIPAPATWASGPVTTYSLRADVTNGVTYLAGRPLFIGYNIAPPSVPGGGTANVPFDGEVVDNWGGHSPATDNMSYFCQSPGWYFTSVVVAFNYTSATQAMFTNQVVASYGGLAVNLFGDSHPGGAGYAPGLLAVDLWPMANVGTDYVRVVARNGAAGAVSLASSFPTFSYIATRWVAALAGTTGLPVPSNPAWPVPPSYVTSSFLNSNIRDTLRFLTYPPLFRGYLATASGPSLPGSAFPGATVVPMDTTAGATSSGGLAMDNYSGWKTGPQAYQVPVAGVYTLAGQLAVSSGGGGGTLNVGFSVNGGTTTWVKSIYNPSTGAVPQSICGVHRARLNAGDQVQLMANQTSGGAVTMIGSGTSAGFCKLIVFWESA